MHIFLKVLWEIILVLLFLLALALIGSGDNSAKESGYSIFFLYSIVSYFSKRSQWFFKKLIKPIYKKMMIPSRH